MTTFYDVLGVPPDASTDEIRTAYRQRLKESHPDLNDDEDASAATKRVIRARDVLTDEDERRRYDRLGHDEYVGREDDAVDENDVSNAAAAARHAGWASEGTDRADGAAAEDRSSTRADQRRGARERRRRERAAADRVGTDRGTATESRRAGGTGTDATSTDGPGSDGASASGTGSSAGSASSSAGGGTASGGTGDVGGGSGWAWNATGGYSVRQGYDTGFRRSRLIPAVESLPLLGAAFVLYPVMVFSALFPPFHLVVNVVVAVCIVCLVGYLQSVPEVGVFVFGIWSLLTPAAFLAAGVPLTGLVGILALTTTWLPFGLSALTLTLVRP